VFWNIKKTVRINIYPIPFEIQVYMYIFTSLYMRTSFRWYKGPMPEISKERLKEMESNLYMFIDLFIHIFRIIIKTNKWKQLLIDNRACQNPEMYVTLALIMIISHESDLMKKIKIKEAVEIRWFLSLNEGYRKKMEDILLNQWGINSEMLDSEMERILIMPPICQKIIDWTSTDTSFFKERLEDSPYIDIDKDFLLYIKELLISKALTYLSPSAVMIKEGVMCLINKSVDFSSVCAAIYWHEGNVEEEEKIKERISRWDKYFVANDKIYLNWDNSFWFVVLVTNWDLKRIFFFFLDHKEFSKKLVKKIKEILSSSHVNR